MEGAVIRGVVLAWALALVVGACSGVVGNQTGAIETRAAPSTAPADEAIVIELLLTIADSEGADIVATGEVLEGSTLGDEPFCIGGTAEDRHANEDPLMEPHGLLARTITCPDGTVRIAFTPDMVPMGETQGGSWTIVSGTGALEGLSGTGELRNVPDTDPDRPAHETLTGTVTR